MSTRTNRVIAAGALTLAAALAITGCSSAGADGGGGTEKITITFANADPSATWDKVIKGFEKANPNIMVKQLNIPYAQYTSTINQRMGQGGGGIDAFVVDAGGAIVDWQKRGYLADISDLRSDAEAAAVSKDMVQAREVDGKLYALEPWTTSQFLYYNKSILDKAGVTAPGDDPSKPWTYEELTAAAQKVKDAGAAEYPFLFDQWDSYYQFQMVAASAGGGDGISAEGKVDFTNAGWQKALTWYHDLFTSGISPRGITNDKNGALFQTGKAAFMISGPWGAGVAAQGKIDFGIAAAPYFDGGKKATSTDSWGIALSAKSKQADAAKKFLRYAVIDPKGNALSAEVAGITPTNKEAFADYVKTIDASSGAATAKFGDIMEYELQNSAVHRPNVVGYSVFEPGTNQMLSDIRNGSDPSSRAKQAGDDISAQISRLK
ncbi:ABC transporter substrate-binding protein [Microbacterium sp. USTB-Y]|uniref:ABC transporter substrate-binding protein n=1 Tax=Microbacterium sp. USTB-Y TaxID=2823692 RepID=UPI0020417ED2|nr:sugar ABC transporter substrate-binding protein [Microbacterium sp. USTB-Y]